MKLLLLHLHLASCCDTRRTAAMASADHVAPEVIYCFGNFELREQTKELRKFGVRVPLQPQPQTILLELVRAPDQVVTRTHLRCVLWGNNVFVDYERNLTRSINKLRLSLGDTADNPRFVETLPGIGYRFIAPVERRTQQFGSHVNEPVPEHIQQGFQYEQSAEARYPASRSRRALAWTSAVLIVLGMVGVFAFIGAKYRPEADRTTSSVRRTRIVGVLPFENISDKGDKEYFVRGLGEEVNEQLSKVASLQVVGRAVLSNVKRADLRKTASELGLDSVVVGTVRAEGDQARISVQLIEPDTGRTLWSEVYDRQLKDLISVQSEIAFRVVDALEIQLSTEDQDRLAKRLTSSPEAYELYLRAQLARQPQAVELFRKAIQVDPEFAAAYGQLAIRYSFLGAGDKQYLNLGLEAAKKAISLDPQLATGHIGLANILGEMGRLRDSRLSFLRALQWDPNSMEAMENLSVIDLELGRYDEALYWASRGLRLARTVPWPYFHVGLILTSLGPHDVAWKFIKQTEGKFPTVPRNQELVALEQYLNGDDQAALQVLRTAVQHWPQSIELKGELAYIAFVTGAPDAASLTTELAQSAPDFWMGPGFRPGFLNAVLLIREGQPQGSKLLQEVVLSDTKEIEGGSDDPAPFVEMAAIRCFQGHRNEGLDWLRRAYSVGFRGLRFLERDPFFDSLEGDSGYQQLISQMKQDVLEMQNRSQADEAQIVANLNGNSAQR